jgi:hypothetical protein
MEDVSVSNDLRQLSHGQVRALEYSHYDINGYRFWTAKLEESHPLAATTNSWQGHHQHGYTHSSGLWFKDETIL